MRFFIKTFSALALVAALATGVIAPAHADAGLASLANNDWCRMRGNSPNCDSPAKVKVLGSIIEIVQFYRGQGYLQFLGNLQGNRITGGKAFVPWRLDCPSLESTIVSGTVSGDYNKIEVTYQNPTYMKDCVGKNPKIDKAVFIRKTW